MIRRILYIAVVMMFASQLAPDATRTFAQDALPEGVPQGSEEGTVHRVVDGEKVYVRRENGDLFQVLLSGIDVPEEGECYFDESKDHLTGLIPKGAVVYLEQSGTADRSGAMIVRYLWLPGEDDSKALLINTKMVREGYAGYDGSLDSPRYYENIRNAQKTAREDDRGIWGTCGGIHVEAPTFTAEELDYMTWLNPETATIDESLVKFYELTEVISDEQINDTVWRAEIAAVFTTWELAFQAAEARVPPPEFARLHQLWIDVLWHLNMTADYMNTLFATFDLGSFELAVDELDLTAISIEAFVEEYIRIHVERGAPVINITIAVGHGGL